MTALEHFERACSHDRVGEEAAAIPHYERALELGLPDAQERAALLGLGSSLRNVQKCSDAVRVLENATRRYPNDPALQSFLALALYSQGRTRDAFTTLLEQVLVYAPVGTYERALRQYKKTLA